MAVLALSLLSRIVWVLAGAHTRTFVDLRVYLVAARTVGLGGLYDFALSEYTPTQPLPFTYPPFAALFFWPLGWLPFGVAAAVWLVVTFALLFLVITMCLALLRAHRGESPLLADVPRTHSFAWTAAVLWLDPVRTNLDYGQINVVLMALGVGAAYLTVRCAGRRGDLLPGFFIGLAAGIKLTPAVGGLFLLARRRWLGAVFSGVVFAGTIGVACLAMPKETRRYFTVLIGQTGPIGDPAKIDNQALRGALSRFAGHDLATGPVVLAAIAVAGVLLAGAWWVCRRCDALIALVLVQMFGLCASPISWIHHFVWVVPMLIWLVHGPLWNAPPAQSRPARALVVVTFAYCLLGVHGMNGLLAVVGVHAGLGWALCLCPGLLVTIGLVVVVGSGRRTLEGTAAPTPVAGGTARPAV